MMETKQEKVMSGKEQERKLFEALANARYYSKRAAGISDKRKDGSKCSINNDIESVGAEYYAAEKLGCSFNATIGSKGDGGSDFVLPIGIEVIWLGVNKHTGEPREGGNLIVNPHEPQRWSDVYVVVKGSIDTGFDIVGWTTHRKLVALPMQDFGYGDRYAMHVDDLLKGDLSKFKKV